jgi:integrase
MPRKLRVTAKIDTLDRLKLHRRGKPYFTVVAPGVRLGYRRTERAGTWVVEKSNGKSRCEWHKRLDGVADDYEAADGEHVLTFWQAADKARTLARDSASGAPATWAQALDDYEADLKARGGNLYNGTLVRNNLATHAPALLSKPVALLTAAELKRWRNAMVASHLKLSSVVRITKSAQASLNHAANHDPRIANREAWRVGLGGLHDTYQPVDRVVPDSIVRQIMAEANALDAAFGLFVHVAAETGARAAQIARLTVADLQADSVTMPSSRKGKKRTITRRLVPIGRELAARLKRAAGNRAPDAPLLLRADGGVWRPKKNNLQHPFAIVAKRVGISDSMYCLRHSAIVRALLAGVPAKLVASNADTSLVMLERTYARYISAHGEDVARRGLLLAATDNVVSLERRA